MSEQKSLPVWGPEKKLKWFLDQRVQRSYRDDVLLRLEAFRKSRSFTVQSYGGLTVAPEKYPLYTVSFGNTSKKNILITGGVHGYETSGVKGALLFLEKHAANYAEHFNFVVAPCVSPWSYETINRLDPVMENPNREFKADGKAQESELLMKHLAHLGIEFDGHLDLHETTNSDRHFLPEEYSKNGLVLDAKDVDIPDGFYLIGMQDFKRLELEEAMMDSVRKITHIAKPDARGMILDTPISFEGMVHNQIPGICADLTAAKSRLGAYTTEMYPDSPRFKSLTSEQVETLCSEVQVACIRGALDFWMRLP